MATTINKTRSFNTQVALILGLLNYYFNSGWKSAPRNLNGNSSPPSNLGSNVTFSNEAYSSHITVNFNLIPLHTHTHASHTPYTLSYSILYLFCSTFALLLFNVLYCVCRYYIHRYIFNFLFSMLECEQHERKYPYLLCSLMYPKDLE